MRTQGARGERPDRPQLAYVCDGNLIERTVTGEPIVAAGQLPLTRRRTYRWGWDGRALRHQQIGPERRGEGESKMRSLHWGILIGPLPPPDGQLGFCRWKPKSRQAMKISISYCVV